MEVSFFVEEDALRKLCPKMNPVEAGFLEAFDTARKRIYEVADKVYVRGNQGAYAYSLAAEDF